jgi:hypothetical protein
MFRAKVVRPNVARANVVSPLNQLNVAFGVSLDVGSFSNVQGPKLSILCFAKLHRLEIS